MLEVVVVSSDGVKLPSVRFKQLDHFPTAVSFDFDHPLTRIIITLVVTGVNKIEDW